MNDDSALFGDWTWKVSVAAIAVCLCVVAGIWLIDVVSDRSKVVRYGKDFAAVKINSDSKSGWLNAGFNFAPSMMTDRD